MFIVTQTRIKAPVRDSTINEIKNMINEHDTGADHISSVWQMCNFVNYGNRLAISLQICNNQWWGDGSLERLVNERLVQSPFGDFNWNRFMRFDKQNLWSNIALGRMQRSVAHEPLLRLQSNCTHDFPCVAPYLCFVCIHFRSVVWLELLLPFLCKLIQPIVCIWSVLSHRMAKANRPIGISCDLLRHRAKLWRVFFDSLVAWRID